MGFHFSPILDLIFDVSTQTGVMLDTTFTVKALRGLLVEMKKNPGRFKGRRILFIHTGTNVYRTQCHALCSNRALPI